jgi:two-component system chemotaxis response regulator CheY
MKQSVGSQSEDLMADKPKALVVDDTPFHSNFLSMYLRMKHYDVTVASDGVEGLAAARQNAFDIVFSDIEMPNMNGIEMLRSIKRLPAYAKVPVVMLSTLDEDEMRNKTKALGAFAYIVKPFNTAKMDELFEKLR